MDKLRCVEALAWRDLLDHCDAILPVPREGTMPSASSSNVSSASSSRVRRLQHRLCTFARVHLNLCSQMGATALSIMENDEREQQSESEEENHNARTLSESDEDIEAYFAELTERVFATHIHGNELLSACRCLSLGRNVAHEVDASMLSRRKLLRVLELRDGEVVKHPAAKSKKQQHDCVGVVHGYQCKSRWRQKAWAKMKKLKRTPGRENYSCYSYNPSNMPIPSKQQRYIKQMLNVGMTEQLQRVRDSIQRWGCNDEQWIEEKLKRHLAAKRSFYRSYSGY